MSTTAEMLNKVLSDLKQVGGIRASALISRDGLIMASDVPPGTRAETFAAMNATMLGAAETAISELGEIPDRVIVESKEGKVITTGAGSKALLIAIISPYARLGLHLVEMGKAAEKIKEVL
ncbi:MAG: roadblock/LC7 domain-containing protein [Methanocellales archaeon]|nr:roadblock/LC7 domain-containing protein [Methanocellales archaeon]